MTPGNYQRRTSTCLLQRNFKSVVAKQAGFAWTNERPGAEESRHKWGWIATVPGSWAELVVDTTTDLEVTSGHLVCLFGAGYAPCPFNSTSACACSQGELKTEQVEVLITYLKSYELMGKAKVECVAGCQ